MSHSNTNSILNLQSDSVFCYYCWQNKIQLRFFLLKTNALFNYYCFFQGELSILIFLLCGWHRNQHHSIDFSVWPPIGEALPFVVNATPSCSFTVKWPRLSISPKADYLLWMRRQWVCVCVSDKSSDENNFSKQNFSTKLKSQRRPLRGLAKSLEDCCDATDLRRLA